MRTVVSTRVGAICLTALTLIGVAACEEDETLPPLGHHVVTIDTDAVVPPSPTALVDPNAPVPLFDRLELAVLRPGESEPDASAVRDFAIDRDAFAPTGASFTIESEQGEELRVRARLYRSAVIYAGEPLAEATIEVVAALPLTPAEGAVNTTIVLRTEDVGAPRGSWEEPLVRESDPSALVHDGEVETSLVGSWPGAAHVPCSEAPGPEETCVPGGAYWMGNPLVKGDDFVESDRQRLVVLSPYLIDTREVRVGELRAWLATQPPEIDTVPRTKSDPEDEAFYCTYADLASPEVDARRPIACPGSSPRPTAKTAAGACRPKLNSNTSRASCVRLCSCGAPTRRLSAKPPYGVAVGYPAV